MMSNLAIGLTGLGVVILLLAFRVPVAIALGAVSIVGIWVMRGSRAAFGALGTVPHEFSASWVLSAIPMFLLMGSFASHSGMTTDIFAAARVWLGRLPGGLAVATNIGSAGFAALSGSSLATTVTMGRLAIPPMLRHGYDPGLATAVVAASGTLGALIPPSLAFIIYGWYAEVSISKLLVAGILPGLLTAGVYAAMVIWRCWLNPKLAPLPDKAFSKKERLASLLPIWPIPLIVVGVIGGIYTGVTTPTEAGAAGAFLVFAFEVVRRKLTWRQFTDSVVESAKTTANLLFIVIGTVFFTRFLALAGIPLYLADVMQEASISPLMAVAAMSVILLFLGMFLEGIGIMLIALPIMLPVLRAMDMDLIWIGVLVVKYVEIGLLTPPVGLNVFVVKGIVGDQVALKDIFRGITWFIGAEVLIMILLIAFPAISTFLPSLMD